MKKSRIKLSKVDYKALCKQIEQRDRGRCRVPGCGSRVTEVHHIVFRSHGGDDASWNLISLCSRCHRAVHERYLIILPLIKEVLNGIGGQTAVYEDIINADKGVQWQFVNGWHPQENRSRIRRSLKRNLRG